MEKLSRVLFLYSKLKKGERINKNIYCAEYECSPRAFDRDVEDIRLFLSEAYSAAELVYDRFHNEYYLTISEPPLLSTYDFFILSQLLISSSALRKDELLELMAHLASHTERSRYCMTWITEKLDRYSSQVDASIVKIHGDLTRCIQRQDKISISFRKTNGTIDDILVIPCDIRRDRANESLSLCALDAVDVGKSTPDYYALDRIESFVIKGKIDRKSIERVERYKSTY